MLQHVVVVALPNLDAEDLLRDAVLRERVVDAKLVFAFCSRGDYDGEHDKKRRGRGAGDGGDGGDGGECGDGDRGGGCGDGDGDGDGDGRGGSTMKARTRAVGTRAWRTTSTAAWGFGRGM